MRFPERGSSPSSGVDKLAQSKRHNYRGTNFSLRGEKDRFVLPAGFRKTVTESSEGRTLFFSTHPNLPCLTAYGESHIDYLEEQIDKAEAKAIAQGREYDRDAAEINMGSMIEDVTFDASGRFTFPPALRRIAGIDDKVVFLGSMRVITVWDPETFLRQDETVYGDPQMLVREFLAGQGKK